MTEPALARPPETVWDDAANGFRRWTAGDDSALDDLVRTMTPVLWQVVRAYGLEQDLAEDVVQTTWLRLVRSRADVADAQAVAAWLTTTARREAWRVGRRTAREEPVEDESLSRAVGHQRSVESEVVARAESDLLWAAVAGLSERCRRLLRVIAFSDRPNYSELAHDLGMPVGSIGPTRGRCLEKLRGLLAPSDKGAHS